MSAPQQPPTEQQPPTLNRGIVKQVSQLNTVKQL